MRVLGLDPATICGWCGGDPVERSIVSGSFRIRSKTEPIEIGPFNMFAWLRDHWEFLGPPDGVVVERYMEPAAQKNSDAIPLQIMVYGVIVAFAQAHGVKLATPTRQDVLAHFTGRRGYGGDRKAAKRAVLERCWMVGLLPRDCFDEDRADAIATWDWGCGHWRLAGKVRPNLVMFGS